MSRNGAGIYQLPVYGNPVVNGTVIDPVWANGNFSDMATALTTSVSSDGQTPITGNLMMSGFKHTGAAAATGAGQYQVWGTAGNFAGLTSSAAIGVALATPSDARYTFDVLTVAGGAVGFNNSGATNAYGAVTGAAYVAIAQAVPMVFTSGSAEWLRTDGAGKLFVGTTTGAAKFNVANTGTNQTLNLLNSSSGSGSTIIGAYTNGTDADFSVTVSQVGAASKFTRIGTSVANPLSLQTAGTNWITLDGVGRLSGTALHNNSSSPTGTTNQYIASGTYTPTLTAVTNVASSTPAPAQWVRVGNVVTVGGTFQVAPSVASTGTQLGISLPIPSTLSVISNVGGTANGTSSSSAGLPGRVQGDVANVRAAATWVADAGTGTGNFAYTFVYVIL